MMIIIDKKSNGLTYFKVKFNDQVEHNSDTNVEPSASDNDTMHPLNIGHLVLKEGKFLKKIWWCVGGRV